MIIKCTEERPVGSGGEGADKSLGAKADSVNGSKDPGDRRGINEFIMSPGVHSEEKSLLSPGCTLQFVFVILELI